jgi:hypothetical protein
MPLQQTRSKQLAVTLFLVGLATFFVHELFHWLAGTAFGYPMHVTLNRVWPATAVTPLHAALISAAGPLATYAQAGLGYSMVARGPSIVGFAMVYMAFFMRLIATAVSVFNPNDEARISQALGIGLWTLPALVVVALFVLVFRASRRLRLSFREQLVCYLVASAVVTLIVGADRFLFRAN